MRPLTPCLLALVTALFSPSSAHPSLEYRSPSAPSPPLVLALQTHMPTKSGDVPHLQPMEEPLAPPKIKLDPAELQREARELLELSQSLQADIESVNQGLHPKDTVEKLKRIQKLAKHLRGEIAP